MKTLYAIYFFCFFSSLIYAQDTIIERSFPDSTLGLLGASYAFDIREDIDGGYVVVGATNFPTGAIRHNIRLLKVDNNLNVLWDTTYWTGAIIAQEGRSVEVLSSGDYLIVGYDQDRPFSMRVTSTLDTVWTNTLASTGGRWEVVKNTTQGDLILGGWTLDNSNQIIGMIKKITTNGITVWENTFSGYGIRDLEILPDGSLISAGLVGFNGKIMKHNAEGGIIWEQTIINSKGDVINDIIVGEDGSIFFAAEGSGFAGYSPYGGKLSSEGEILWTAFPTNGLGKGTAVAITQGGAIALTGSLFDFWGFNDIGFLDALDQDGMPIPNSFPEGISDMTSISSMISDSDGCLVLAGQSSGAFYIRKDCGEVVNNTKSPENEAYIEAFPNPAAELLNVKLTEHITLPIPWHINNAQGQIIQQGLFTQLNNEIVTSSFPAGLYYLCIGEARKQIKSFIVE